MFPTSWPAYSLDHDIKKFGSKIGSFVLSVMNQIMININRIFIVRIDACMLIINSLLSYGGFCLSLKVLFP